MSPSVGPVIGRMYQQRRMYQQTNEQQGGVVTCAKLRISLYHSKYNANASWSVLTDQRLQFPNYVYRTPGVTAMVGPGVSRSVGPVAK